MYYFLYFFITIFLIIQLINNSAIIIYNLFIIVHIFKIKIQATKRDYVIIECLGNFKDSFTAKNCFINKEIKLFIENSTIK